MKRRIEYTIVLIPLLLVACSNSDNVETVTDNTVSVRNIAIRTEPIATGNISNTRSIAQGSMTSFQIGYQLGDSMGIFPEGGYQIPFALPIPEGRTVSSSDINAEGWATRTGITYSVYYPYNRYNVADGISRAIPWDYRKIQHQTTHNTRDHLGKYWFIGANNIAPTVNADGTATFLALTHIMDAIIRVQCYVPATADYRRIMLVADDTLFATHGTFDLFEVSSGEVDLSNPDDVPIPCPYQPFHALGHTNHVTLDIESASRNQDEVLTCYMSIPETDLTGHHMYLYLWDSNDNLYVGDYAIPADDKDEGYYPRNSIRNLLFDNMAATTTLDVKLNDWEKEELCPTCTPVAW